MEGAQGVVPAAEVAGAPSAHQAAGVAGVIGAVVGDPRDLPVAEAVAAGGEMMALITQTGITASQGANT